MKSWIWTLFQVRLQTPEGMKRCPTQGMHESTWGERPGRAAHRESGNRPRRSPSAGPGWTWPHSTAAGRTKVSGGGRRLRARLGAEHRASGVEDEWSGRAERAGLRRTRQVQGAGAAPCEEERLAGGRLPATRAGALGI